MPDEYQQLWNAGPVRITTTSGRRHIAAAIPARCQRILEDGTRCSNRKRPAQGAKYCDEHATSKDYVLQQQAQPTEQAICPSCGNEFQRNRQITVRHPAALAWRDHCPQCTSKTPLNLKTLIRHNVSYGQASHWLNQGDELTCELPGCDRRLWSHGSDRVAPHIDHDHACCNGEHSCGDCVRGVLCGSCNMGLGMYERLLTQTTSEAITAYLAKSCK